MKRVVVCLLLCGALPPVAHAQDAVAAFRRSMVNAAMGMGAGHIPNAPATPQAPQDNGGVTLQKTLTYHPMNNPLGHASLMGISLGMSALEATAQLRQACQADPSIRTETLRTAYKGVDMETQSYPSMLSCQRNGDAIPVSLAPPVMGGVVIKVERNVNYPAVNAPGYDALKAELVTRYSAHLPPIHNASATTALYALKDGTVTEKADGDPVASSPSSDPRASVTQAWMQIEVDVVPQNPSAVSHLSIAIEDIGAVQTITTEVIKQLNAAVDAKLAHNTVKPAL